MKLRPVLREILPPLVWRSGAKLRRLINGERPQTFEFEYGVEQSAKFYDIVYQKGNHYRRHYTDSPYYPLWTVIADRIRAVSATKVLDIGCGPGQVAALLRDQGLKEYLGVDFSTDRISRAHSVCPDYAFHVEDIFDTDVLEKYDYDCVLALEFFEHIERDIDVLERVRVGSNVIASLPNYPAPGHVRFFSDAKSVERRYCRYFAECHVTTLLANARGKTFFILQGIR